MHSYRTRERKPRRMNPNTAPLINEHRAPKGAGRRECSIHSNVINGLPATDWSDWDEALKRRNHPEAKR
jgi:hypothetical protein